MNCTEPQQFNCAPGPCIANSLRCDGELDCLNGSDELNCDGFDPVESTPQESVEPTSVPTNVTRATTAADAAAAAAGDGGVQNQTLTVPPPEGAGGLSVSVDGAAGPGGERENSASGPDRGWLLVLVASYVALTL